VSHDLASAIESLERRIGLLEDERDLRALLAYYGFYVDHGLIEEWMSLFTEDIVWDYVVYDGDDLTTIDPSMFRKVRLVGHDDVRAATIMSAGGQSIFGRSQHHMDGPPAVFQVDGDRAICRSYAVVYARPKDSYGPELSFMSITMNRWNFRRTADGWKISGLWRRRLGSDDSADFLTV